MTTALWLRDIGAFGLQLAVLIGAGAAIWRVLHVRQSGVSLTYWRILLLICLLLPVCQPWRVAPRPSLERSIAPPAAGANQTALESPGTTAVPERGAWPASALVLAGLGAGVAARTLWLLLGAYQLRRLRRAAVRLEPVPSIFRDAQEKIGARADFFVSDRIAGPITFGLKRPVVMVPPRVMAMETPLQDAIACHELLHVRRRDWLHVVVEEAIRAVFWFHPAVCWLIGRIQLSREHVVDEAVIRVTRSRDRYVEALVAVALTGSPAALAPAPRFLRRRFLKRRVAHILKESTMTTRRLIASVTVSAGALGLAAVLAVRSFPLEARPLPPDSTEQAPASTSPVQIVKGGEHLLHASLPEYPKRAIEQRIGGDVVLDLSVDDRGEIADARVVSGPDELRRAALEAVLQWHYSPESLRSAPTQVALRFTVPEAGAEDRDRAEPLVTWLRSPDGHAVAIKVLEQADAWHQEPSPAHRVERQMVELRAAMRDPAATESQKEEYKIKFEEARERLEQIRAASHEGRPETVEGTPRLAQIKTERVPQETAQEIVDRAGIAVGDVITEAAAKRISGIVRSVDEHLRVRFGRDAKGGLVLTIIAP